MMLITQKQIQIRNVCACMHVFAVCCVIVCACVNEKGCIYESKRVCIIRKKTENKQK